MLGDMQMVGSFQDRRRISRTGNPLHAIWREVARLGTVDNLSRIAEAQNGDPRHAKTASLRFQQGIEFREAASSAGPLSRPLLLYYSALNLMRGLLLVTREGMGSPTHGAKYRKGNNIFSCSVEIEERGTLSQMLALLGTKRDKPIRYTLADCISHSVELRREHDMASPGVRRIVTPVHVHAFFSGSLQLTYIIPGLDQAEFAANWRELIPWFSNDFSLHHEKEKTIVANEKIQGDARVMEMCADRLWADYHERDDAVWFDTLNWGNLILVPRIMPYAMMLFILSNVCRYEPELLSKALSESNDRAFALIEAINAAERYFAQNLISLAVGGPIYFS